jgi:hypothetical protein
MEPVVLQLTAWQLATRSNSYAYCRQERRFQRFRPNQTAPFLSIGLNLETGCFRSALAATEGFLTPGLMAAIVDMGWPAVTENKFHPAF